MPLGREDVAAVQHPLFMFRLVRLRPHRPINRILSSKSICIGRKVFSTQIVSFCFLPSVTKLMLEPQLPLECPAE